MQKHQELQTITCPNCGEEIPLTDVLTKQFEEKIRLDYDIQLKKEDEELQIALKAKDLQHGQQLKTERVRIAEQAKKEAQESVKIEIEAIHSHLAEKSKLLKEAKSREVELARRQQDLEEKERALVLEVEKRVQAEKSKIIESAKASVEIEVRDLKAELTEKDQKLQVANRNELELRKRTRELEQREQNLELEMHRRLDEERQKIGAEARAKIEEDYRLKLREKEVTIDGMNKQIDELKRKAEQGSVQLQGEAQEVELDDVLRSSFKYDEITGIGKGEDGADVLQAVHNNLGRPCGSILFESKHTKNWNDSWIEKAKEDRLEKKADLVVIVFQALPQDVNHIVLRDGVWVCDLQSAIGLATALREGMLKLSEANNALAGKWTRCDAIPKEWRRSLSRMIFYNSTQNRGWDASTSVRFRLRDSFQDPIKVFGNCIRTCLVASIQILLRLASLPFSILIPTITSSLKTENNRHLLFAGMV